MLQLMNLNYYICLTVPLRINRMIKNEFEQYTQNFVDNKRQMRIYKFLLQITIHKGHKKNVTWDSECSFSFSFSFIWLLTSISRWFSTTFWKQKPSNSPYQFHLHPFWFFCFYLSVQYYRPHASSFKTSTHPKRNRNIIQTNRVCIHNSVWL